MLGVFKVCFGGKELLKMWYATEISFSCNLTILVFLMQSVFSHDF